MCLCFANTLCGFIFIQKVMKGINNIVNVYSTLIFQGWMNEIQDYNPETYHPALTHSVFATLEGSCLRLNYPRNNISRRATYEEKVLDACFVKSHCFQLAKSKVRREWRPSNNFLTCFMLHIKLSSLQIHLQNWELCTFIFFDIKWSVFFCYIMNQNTM